MNKKLHYYFTLFAIAAVPFIAGAAEKDSVVVDGEVKFYSLQKGSGNSNVSRAGGQTTKAEVTIVGIENKNKEANKRWRRNVEVELSLVYKDEKSKGKGQ